MASYSRGVSTRTAIGEVVQLVEQGRTLRRWFESIPLHFLNFHRIRVLYRRLCLWPASFGINTQLYVRSKAKDRIAHY
jgi:hypothetical protein